MLTREIASSQWSPFLDDFSKRNQGAMVSVQLLNSRQGAEFGAQNLPLVGISDDYKADGGERIEVFAGDSPDANVMLAVLHPSHIRLAEMEDGRPVALQIQAEDGAVTLVRFGAPEELSLPDEFTRP